MSYKTVKEIKNHRYVYIVRSEREGDRVRQVFVKYLGREDRVSQDEIDDAISESEMYEPEPVERETPEVVEREPVSTPVTPQVEVLATITTPTKQEVEKEPEEKRLEELEYGTKVVELPIKDDFSDPQTLRETRGRLEDGIYLAGDDYVYEVKDHEIKILPEYRNRYDWNEGKYIITERPLTPEDISQVPIFHGSTESNLTLKELSTEFGGKNYPSIGNEFDGIYFTTKPSEAKSWSTVPTGGVTPKGTVIEARISPDAKVVQYKDIGDKFTEDLLAEGVDVILKYPKGGDYGEVIILNPKVLVSPSQVSESIQETPQETIVTETKEPWEMTEKGIDKSTLSIYNIGEVSEMPTETKKEYTVTIPNRFWDDHADRFADQKQFEWDEIKRTSQKTTVKLNEAEYNNLIQDAEYYADVKRGVSDAPKGLALSAQATIRALKNIEVETPEEN